MEVTPPPRDNFIGCLERIRKSFNFLTYIRARNNDYGYAP